MPRYYVHQTLEAYDILQHIIIIIILCCDDKIGAQSKEGLGQNRQWFMVVESHILPHQSNIILQGDKRGEAQDNAYARLRLNTLNYVEQW